MEFYERVSGARFHAAFYPPRRRASDMPAGLADDIMAWTERFPKVLDDIEALLDREPHLQAAHASISASSRPTRRSTGASPDRCCAPRAWPGICARRSPMTSMTSMDFDIPIGKNGDCYDRYLGAHGGDAPVDLRIMRQALEKMPKGPVRVDDHKVTPPHAREMKTSMEALIHHFKLYTEGYHVPAGETYTAVEAPKGEFGVYLVADGSNRPYRCHIRAPGFAHLQGDRFHVEGPHAGRCRRDYRLAWISCSGRSTDERRQRARGGAAEELRLHAGQSGQGQGSHRQISGRAAEERGDAAARSRAASGRQLAAARGDGRGRRYARHAARSASTRSRPSTPCSI